MNLGMERKLLLEARMQCMRMAFTLGKEEGIEAVESAYDRLFARLTNGPDLQDLVTSADLVDKFLADRCEIVPGTKTQFKDLYSAFLAWVKNDQQIQLRQEPTMVWFSRELMQRLEKKNSNVVYYLDVVLKGKE